MNPLVINLFGQPSAGKSTLAMDLTAEMKYRGMNVEYVSEFAKHLTWSKRTLDLSDQIFLFGNQNHLLERLRDQVDYIVTDSSILLGLFYATEDYYSYFEPLVKQVYKSYRNFNVLVNRTKSYNPVGRNQTEEESDAIGNMIWRKLDEWNLQYIRVAGDKNAPTTILDSIANLDVVWLHQKSVDDLKIHD